MSITPRDRRLLRPSTRDLSNAIRLHTRREQLQRISVRQLPRSSKIVRRLL